MTRRCTSFDVAEGAGVSQSTVSKALRGSEGVSIETRRRVLEVWIGAQIETPL
ncbi:helix-turn-helix domain-containing protein [Sphingomonas aerolata]|uniref:LacI family DNA-binding transcriptional regulator n=1 Tax=Sphingomonas sp. CFBP 8764 TaxID=2775275 RepID=UPI0017817986|nr:helix-turn-helix domain-containing protein [Sphingomonas sp. CFBP 8764]MBD8551967.1 helix-turn-helix domain-containing protein [Sphingomonas sp. CFBP 8764]